MLSKTLVPIQSGKSRFAGKSYVKIFFLAVAWLLFAGRGNAQVLDDIVRAILINNNFNKVEVVEVSRYGAGKIQLEGSVDTYYDKLWLDETIMRIPGVTEVSNQVVVDNPPVSDELLASNIQKGIVYVSSTDKPQDIEVEVNDGIVYLSGNVIYSDEKNTAHKIASLHEGVRGIVNKIEVKPVSEVVLDNNLQSFLEGIITERYPEEKKVTVIVNNGEVTLEGKVSSEKVKEEITGNISEMSGVTKVNNNLEVNSKTK